MLKLPLTSSPSLKVQLLLRQQLHFNTWGTNARNRPTQDVGVGAGIKTTADIARSSQAATFAASAKAYADIVIAQTTSLKAVADVTIAAFITVITQADINVYYNCCRR